MRRLLRLTTLALLALIPATSGTATAAALPGARVARAPYDKVVRYHGYRLAVPAGWPIYNLTADPTVCVRFNRHAVYLGQPSAQQRCPAHATGRTEAILVQPLVAGGARAHGSAGPALPPAGDPSAQPPQGSSTERAVPGAGLVVTATWRTDPAVVARALGVRSLTATGARAAAATPAPAGARVTHRAGDPVFVGLGFDACSTPSRATMSAWATSPYRAVGIYIGGANEACAQPNLNPAWVNAESAAGWNLIPIYVGLQAPKNECGCAGIVPAQASAEGTAAADDAINQAQANGLGPGNPIYDDMEAYSRGAVNTSSVLAFLAAWTKELHVHGFLSGVYSSTGSGVLDLVNEYSTGYAEPDDIWFADWNGQQTTASSSLPSSDWANNQRLHQYQGAHNATYGGTTLNIDSDYLDGATASASASAAALFPNGTFIQVAGSPYFYEIAGGAPLLVSDWSDVGGAQTYTVITPQQFASLDPVPVNGTMLETDTGATYVIAGGAPMYITSLALFPGSPQPLLVDEWDIDNAGNPLSHLNATPTNGTFLTTTSGMIYRVAGGAPIGVTKWSVFGGVQPSVTIDPWDIANVSNPLSRLVYRPAVGTVVEGLPSGAYWAFGPKNRYLTTPTPAAVRVDDHGLVPFSAIPCRVPGLGHMTLAQVKAALRKADCHLGKVQTHLVTQRRHTLRVVKQVPKPRTRHIAYYPVGVTLG